MADFKPSEPIVERFGSEDPAFRFYFYILSSGHWELKSPYRSVSQGKLILSNSFSSAIFYPEMEGRMFLPTNHRQIHLSIYIRPSMLNTYIGGRLHHLPKALLDITQGSIEIGFSHESPLSQMMNLSIWQLLECPYTGPMKELFMENKAIELIVHKLAQTITLEDNRDPPLKMELHEMDRIHRASEILCRDLETPPSLSALAHAVGTNHCRLNRGFRELYGTSVFGYLRQRRLIEARRLIEIEDASVTQAALNVGYNSISSFSKAFYDYFGMRPMNCRKKKIISI
ncbi:MAG: AraC family transcriptional regulator [Desulfobacteraceae bacterium]|jgi:AraC family transcriptional regulator, transcriptional activator of the genes for pyochelin and ferripyochelin receptors